MIDQTMEIKMSELKNKNILITGGAGDIGTVAARLCLDAGARVMITDIRAEALEKTQQHLDHENLFCCPADITVEDDVVRLVATANDTLGGLDGMFANAGVEGVVAPMSDYPLAAFNQVMAVNVRGVWLSLKAAMPLMQSSGGSIVITSSIAGLKGAMQLSAYCASKHAVIGLMRCAALEGIPHKIRVNTINPSPVKGRMISALEQGIMNAETDLDAARAAIEASIPMGRYADPEDIAEMLVYLLSDRAKFMTGSVLSVDGGCCLT